VAFLSFVVLIFFLIPWRFFEYPVYFSIIVGLLLIVSTAAVGIFIASPYFSSHFTRRAGRLNVISDGWFVAIVTLLGILIRLWWILEVPPVQFSDFLAYWQLAEQLVDDRRYAELVGSHELRAYRPMGLPMALAGGIFLFGDSPAVPVLINLLAYVTSSMLVFGTAQRLGHAGMLLLGFVVRIAVNPHLA
jgi:hypothetical protein